MADFQNIVELDNPFPASDDSMKDQGQISHKHESLKTSVIIRRNSVLTIIESIIDLKDKTQNALKRVGHFYLSFTEAELSILSELKTLLTRFKNFSDIFSSSLPTFSLLPIIIEVTNYLTTRPVSKVLEILAFWKENANILPTLGQLNELYLSISAGSVPVECLFFTTGLILYGKCSQFRPEKLN